LPKKTISREKACRFAGFDSGVGVGTVELTYILVLMLVLIPMYTLMLGVGAGVSVCFNAALVSQHSLLIIIEKIHYAYR
jgi:hypothetical protein